MYHERVYSWITFWNPLTLILWTVISIESCQLLVGCPFWTYHTLHLEFQKKPRRGLPHRLGKRLVYFLKVIIETMFVYHFTDADLAFEILPKRRGEKENGNCFRYRDWGTTVFPSGYLATCSTLDRCFCILSYLNNIVNFTVIC